MFSKLATALFLFVPVNATWIFTHDHDLNYNRSDQSNGLSPIVVVGSNAFALNATEARIVTQNETCTTSPVQDDKSNYWSPSLYHRSATGDLAAVPLSSVETSYLQYPDQNGKVVAFPSSLRMTAGNPYRTQYNSSNVEDRAINFVCLDASDQTTGPTAQLSQQNCSGGMRLQATFPSCWNGVNIDSLDHRSHMAYPSLDPESGDCPNTHPVKTVILKSDYIYDTSAFEAFTNWVLSNGDYTGYSFHADFINGWKPSTLVAAVDQCTGAIFNNLESCPPFLPSLDQEKANSCSII